jgi:uncharacterized membrane protein
MTDLYRIETPCATGEIQVGNGVVVKAALIFRHLEGRLLANVANWVAANQGTIEKIERKGEE